MSEGSNSSETMPLPRQKHHHPDIEVTAAATFDEFEDEDDDNVVHHQYLVRAASCPTYLMHYVIRVIVHFGRSKRKLKKLPSMTKKVKITRLQMLVVA